MFTEKEQKIRQKWLFWIIKLPVFIMVPGICLFIIAGLSSLLAPVFHFNQIDFYSFYNIISVFSSIGILYLIYYCAYKNSGVVCLLLLLASFSIILLGYAFTIINQINQINLDNKQLDKILSIIL